MPSEVSTVQIGPFPSLGNAEFALRKLQIVLCDAYVTNYDARVLPKGLTKVQYYIYVKGGKWPRLIARGFIAGAEFPQIKVGSK